ncbi:adhesion G-protein coupled receptor G2-like [Ptychodera flava]|uniref:adhesion G-protein coupled receptor G2-like n=1 Tax=Ptychodera flava TaxID=63121 RepID=UPI00396A6582
MLQAKSDEIINTSQCVFWDFDANDGYGDWSSNGCHFVGVEDGRVVCRCNHLTNFAVLMDVHRNQPDAVHLFALDTISKIGCLLSIIGLSATLATYLGFKKLRKTRPQRILINQCIALLCLMLVFIAGIDQTHSYWGCISVAVLLHFFTLAAFMWMGMEAFNMYMAFIRVMPMYISYFMVKIGIIAWGVPLLAVVITLSLGVENYVSGKEYCFMAHYPFYYAYVIPIAVILLYNLVVYTRVIMRLCAKSQATTMDKPQHLHMRWQIRNSICILLLLGFTWIFAFFAVEEVTLLFQYLFCVFNSMQGFFIFIFYCLDQKDAREQWKSACSVCPCFRKKRKKYKYRSPGFDLIYHNPTYTTSQSHRSSISSTKQFSLASKDSVGVNHQTTQTTSPLPHFVQ